ncbi:rubredoxin [Ectothiorhodospiraceae bacterium WFHF3C12]|nr:rubredoxin [Ectothiorhodospiraceae bacterium WFHF3C12]
MSETQTQAGIEGRKAPPSEAYAQYMCMICGWIYDEEQGLPEAGIPPGTRWEDVPEDFLCPECGEPKSMFERIDI